MGEMRVSDTYAGISWEKMLKTKAVTYLARAPLEERLGGLAAASHACENA
jgi:hypothetical protein